MGLGLGLGLGLGPVLTCEKTGTPNPNPNRHTCEKTRTLCPSALSLGKIRSSSSNLPEARQMCMGVRTRAASCCASLKKRYGWLHTCGGALAAGWGGEGGGVRRC